MGVASYLGCFTKLSFLLIDSPHEDDGAGVPDQMVEDDEYGKFVALEKIQCSDYKAFELTPLEYENAVLSEGGAVVVFFQPCKLTLDYVYFTWVSCTCHVIK